MDDGIERGPFPIPAAGEEGPQEEEGLEVSNVGFFVYRAQGKVVVSFDRSVDCLILTGSDAMRLGRSIFERGKRSLRNDGHGFDS